MRCGVVVALALLAACTSGTGDAPQARSSELTVPDGFTIDLFADGLGEVRMLETAPDGSLWAVRSDSGEVLRFELTEDGAAAGEPRVVADGFRRPYGLAFHDDAVYVGDTHEIVRLSGPDWGQREVVVPDLPTGGHWTREVTFGPDGRMYVAIGSSCNLCEEDDLRRAAVVRYDPDGSNEEIVAIGVRNSAGLAFHPVSAELWMSQNERDHLGDDLPPEEINILDMQSLGGHYGWPYCYGRRIPNPEYDDPARCAPTIPPALEMQAHSAPLGIAFYTGDQFPDEYRNDLFVAFHGSWNRSERTGYSVVRVVIEGGEPVRYEPFATGWLAEDGTVRGRPVAVAVGPEGSLYVSDDGAGRIWRIRYTG